MEIHVVSFYVSVKRGDRDRAGRERTLFILLILEKHIVLLLLGLYRNKSKPFAVSNDTLFLSVRSKLAEYVWSFCGHKGNTRQPAPVLASNPLFTSPSQVPSLYLCDLSATRVQVADSSFHL